MLYLENKRTDLQTPPDTPNAVVDRAVGLGALKPERNEQEVEQEDYTQAGLVLCCQGLSSTASHRGQGRA